MLDTEPTSGVSTKILSSEGWKLTVHIVPEKQVKVILDDLCWGWGGAEIAHSEQETREAQGGLSWPFEQGGREGACFEKVTFEQSPAGGGGGSRVDTSGGRVPGRRGGGASVPRP